MGLGTTAYLAGSLDEICCSIFFVRRSDVWEVENCLQAKQHARLLKSEFGSSTRSIQFLFSVS
jgi:hypothetical protein